MTLYDTFSEEEKDNFNNNLSSMNKIIDFGNANGWDVYESLDTWAKRYFALHKEAQ